MKFKVGDKVRLTRETLLRMRHDGLSLLGPSEFVVVKVYGDKVFYEDFELLYIRDGCLELVPEEPEFEYGEAIEVKIDEGFPWVERPFIYFAKGNAIHPYITANINKSQFDAGKKFDFQAFRYARKLRPQLTRKEIAEKFGVSEDFTLVDE